MITLKWGPWSSQIHRDEKQNGGYQGLWRGRECLRTAEFQLEKV